jgi:hypothetical protein
MPQPMISSVAAATNERPPPFLEEGGEGEGVL